MNILSDSFGRQALQVLSDHLFLIFPKRGHSRDTKFETKCDQICAQDIASPQSHVLVVVFQARTHIYDPVETLGSVALSQDGKQHVLCALLF